MPGQWSLTSLVEHVAVAEVAGLALALEPAGNVDAHDELPEDLDADHALVPVGLARLAALAHDAVAAVAQGAAVVAVTEVAGPALALG